MSHPLARWCWVSVGDIGSVTGGLTQNSKREGLTLKLPYLRVANVYANELRLEQVLEIGVREDEVPRALLEKGDLLIVEGNGSLDQIGRVAIWSGSIAPCLHQNHLIKVRFVYAGISRFALFWFLSSAGRDQITRAASSTSGLHTLSISKIQSLEMPLAPLLEQERISAAIESYFTRLDDAVTTLERVERNLKRYRASVLKAAVEGRLVPTEAALARQEGRDYESADDLLQRIIPPPRPNRWSTRSTDLIPGHAALAVGNPKSTLPSGWAWAALVDIARMESGHTPSRSHPEWWDGDVAWIGISDSREHDGGTIYDTEQHTNTEGLANSAARLLPPGTVCVSRTASVGYVVVMGKPMATSQDFVNWTPTEAVSSDWLRVVFSADREALRGFGKGSVHKTIYFPEWLSVHVAVPPLAEQERIVREVDRLLSVAQQVQSSVCAKVKQCARLRQSILKWAFEGKLIDQDPNHEPASALLERIKAERDTPKPAKKKSRT